VEAPPPPSPARRPAIRDRVGILAVLLGALGLRLWHLGARSLWTDEGSSWTAATSPIRELLRLCAEKDASPPLFYLLTSLPMKLGSDEAHLRFVSALASLGLVWLTYRLARLLWGRGLSTLAAAITALSPFQLMYAQEARTYALVSCLTVWALYLFLRAAVLGRRRAWVPFATVSALALYTQNLALLGVGVQGAIVLLSPPARRRLLPWIACQAAVLALYLPWLFVSMAQMARLSHSHWYLLPPDERGVMKVLRAVFVSPVALVSPPPSSPLAGLDAWIPARLAQVLLILIPALPLAAALRVARERSERGALIRTMFAALVLPLAAVLAVSFKMPLWIGRYFVLLTPFLAVLLASGMKALRPRALGVAWAALALVSNAYASLHYDLDYDKEPWRGVVRAIGQASPPGRTAALVPFDVDPFRFYNSKLAHPVAAFEVSHPEVPFASEYTERQLEEMERRAAAQAAPYDEVWVIVRSPNSAVRREVASRTERAAAAGRRPTGRWRWDSAGGPLRVARYDRAPGR